LFPYWLLFGVFAAGSLGYKLLPRDRHRSTPLFVAALFAMMLMIGLRYEVGGDWGNYIIIYEVVRNLPLGQALAAGDPAYNLLNRIAASAGQGMWLINLACAMVFVVGLHALARRQPNPWLAVLVAIPYLVIVVAMGYTRQAAAIGLIMVAVGALEDRRFVRMALLLVLAVTFHKSAILILPILALAMRQHRFVIYVLGSVASAMLFSLFLSRFVDTILTNYVQSEMASQGAGVRIAMNIVPALIFLLFHKRLVLNEDERLIWRNFSLAAIAAMIGLAFLPSTIVDRVALYMVPLQVFVLARAPYAFGVNGRPNGQVMAAVLAYSALVQTIWLVYATHADYWIPYRMALG
jgi:hypothetical protein